MADAEGLNPSVPQGTCGFETHPGHQGRFATKAAEEEALGDFMSELRAGTAVAPTSVTLDGYLTEWLQTVKPQLRETTWASYVVAVDRITWGLGSRKLQALTAIEVERFYATLVNEGGPAGRPLAPKTVRNTHIVLHRALADAERLRLVMRNVAPAERAIAGEAWDRSFDLVICDGTGRPEHPGHFSRQFQRYVGETKLPALREPHNLRHTRATLALNAGEHPKVVSDRLGHATIAVTIDTYSHVAPSLDAAAADTVAANIFGT